MKGLALFGQRERGLGVFITGHSTHDRFLGGLEQLVNIKYIYRAGFSHEKSSIRCPDL